MKSRDILIPAFSLGEIVVKWYSISEGYLNYLRRLEPRIPRTDYGSDRYKPFFGALFTVGELVYVTQVSSPKDRHTHMKQAPDFIKLMDKEKLIAVVNLNYMFPVHHTHLEDVEYKNIDNFLAFSSADRRNAYIRLLKVEMREIIRRDVAGQAVKVHHLKNNFPDSSIARRCFDFTFLEQKCLEYIDITVESLLDK